MPCFDLIKNKQEQCPRESWLKINKEIRKASGIGKAMSGRHLWNRKLLVQSLF